MVCLSADQFAENLLENNGVDVKRSKLEGRKWNFDVEMDSGISGPQVDSRPDEEMPTATARVEIPTVPPRTSARRTRARNASTRSARESTQDQSFLVRNRQNSWMPSI